ncbi:MAG: DNA-3-methyladenine glycosylase family protein [Nevskiales bacterium]
MDVKASLTTNALSEGVAELSARDPDLGAVVDRFGLPPLWARRTGYTTLARIILEQQVSQASAAAIYRRLHLAIGGVTVDRVLSAGVRGLRNAGLTRQKAAYCVGIAQAIHSGELELGQLGRMDGVAARSALIQVHGIGPWTADIYLLMALRKPDVWPHGDLALAKAAMQVKRLRKLPSYDRLTEMAEQWSPWRAVAARILWHYYLSNRQRVLT